MGDQDSDNVAFDLQKGHDVDIQNKTSRKTHKCSYPDCNAVFLRPSRLERHMRSHTGERPYKCSHPGCTKSYTNSSHLKRHAETHNPVKKVYKCTECPLTISNFHGMKRHYTRMHGDKKITCKECGETFNKKHQFAKHQATVHSANVVYKCNKCNRSYLDFLKYTRHRKAHKTYSCPECSKEFDKFTHLRTHRTQHIRNYTCDTCDKVFFSKYGLRMHCKIHLEDRLVLPCPYDNCHRFYHFKSNLESHMRIFHLGEKFYCDICSMGLTSKQRLIEHIQRHNEPKKRKISEVHRKKRKDAGVPRRSALSALIGVNLPHDLEKMVMSRETRINDTATTLEVS